MYDGSYMPSPVGDSPPACRVPLLLLFTKDEYYGSFTMQAGLGSKGITARPLAVAKLEELLPVRGVLDSASRSQLANALLDAYLAIVTAEKGGGKAATVNEAFVAAMQDVWQYHACVAVAAAHSAALPGQTFLSTLTYDFGGGRSPHASDISLLFGQMGMGHGKGKDFDGMTRRLQEAYMAFARTVRGAAWARSNPYSAAQQGHMPTLCSDASAAGRPLAVRSGQPDHRDGPLHAV